MKLELVYESMMNSRYRRQSLAVCLLLTHTAVLGSASPWQQTTPASASTAAADWWRVDERTTSSCSYASHHNRDRQLNS